MRLERYWHGFGLVIMAAVTALILTAVVLEYNRVLCQPREHAWDASALSAGRSAKLAEETYFQAHRADNFAYTRSVADLVVHDRNLNDDRGVTFLWSYAGQSNYTFTTTHRKGTHTFVYTQ